MKLFSKSHSGDSADNPVQKATLKETISGAVMAVARYQGFIIGLVVIVLLGVTIVRVLGLTDPPLDADRAQQDSAKVKTIVIDQKTIERIKSLNDSNVNPQPDFVNRTNPFTE